MRKNPSSSELQTDGLVETRKDPTQIDAARELIQPLLDAFAGAVGAG